MRVLIVGIGGAGCRIADMLYGYDQKSRSLHCTDGIAVDSDASSLAALTSLPKENLIFSRTLDPNHEGNTPMVLPNDEIIARLQSLDPGDIDALIICLGLGGTMAGLAVSLVRSIRKTMVEPVFGLFTLPCDREGTGILVRAADQIDALTEVMDGIILFDNEIWVKKVKNDPDLQVIPGTDRGLITIRKQQTTPQPEHSLVFDALNQLIAKRVNLILRAGEASERPGAEVGEVSLDAGEIVNTLRGMGLAAIGFAREPVPALHPDFIRKLRPAGHSVQENHEKASRIVALGKKAVTEEMSVSCDLADAKKALVLIAGPAGELNMRGYMAFRHWIDLHIGGFEVRSGDYPVSSSRFVAVAVILSGFSHIARVDTLRALRDAKHGTLFQGG
ncbi:MAG: tubulin/FtsZ family protein [Methanoregulaceae archaeon]|nr:tubulin/FtsZ family protein [Methanoregulaceae archaeon]